MYVHTYGEQLDSASEQLIYCWCAPTPISCGVLLFFSGSFFFVYSHRERLVPASGTLSVSARKLCIQVFVCVRVYVRETERKREREKERKREKGCVCVRLCVCILLMARVHRRIYTQIDAERERE